MITQFELFEKLSTERIAKSMRISLNDRGTFSLNQKAFDDLGKPEAVELYYDKVNKLIAMRGCSPELKHASSVRQQGQTKSYLVRAMAFSTHYNINVKGTIVFSEPTIDDGMLVLAIATAVQVPPRKIKQKPQEENTAQTFVAFGNNSTGS